MTNNQAPNPNESPVILEGSASWRRPIGSRWIISGLWGSYRAKLADSQLALQDDSSNGFTLIEILISLTILVVLVGFMTVAFSAISNKQKLNKIVTIITTELEKARQNAFLGKKPLDPNCLTLFGVLVTVNTPSDSAPSLTVATLCDGGDRYDEQEIVLDSDIVITSSLAQVQFDAVARTTNLTLPMQIQVEVENGIFQTISISPSGKIQ